MYMLWYFLRVPHEYIVVRTFQGEYMPGVTSQGEYLIGSRNWEQNAY